MTVPPIGLISLFCTLVAVTPPAFALSIRDIPDLESLTFWERTGGSAPSAYTFDFDSTELTERLLDPLHSGNSDFSSFSAEHFDVFYSDGNGGFNINGEYITVECVVTAAGSGGNIAEVTLNFTDTSQEFGGQVVSFVTLGATPEPDSVSRAIDQDLQTHARLGDTIGQSSRLRLTLGFPSLSPSTTIFNDGFETGNLLAWSSVQ